MCLFLAVLVLVLSPVDIAGLGSPAAFAQDLSSSQGAEEVVHGPAPKLSAADYPQIAGVNARVFVWLAAQLHLWFAAFVLAVPIFVFIIEAIGMKTRDERYDSMAYEFIKISITAYSLTAILGGLLAFSLIIFYPHVFTYMSGIFKETMFFYALL
ncbi:MAG: cytochrome ubiquinol oxidase subunit I, partial [Gammaproteobacteria bacterium]|nr:cytochrome ubiquinol oxidase subunit I [Gammaproteobacteria bacterium]